MTSPPRRSPAFQPVHPLSSSPSAPRAVARVHRRTHILSASAHPSAALSRRAILRHLVALPAAVFLHSSQAHAAKSVTTASLAAPIIQCRRVLGAVPRYIDAGAWDKGRTNVNYCTRVLALRRNMRDVAERLDGDAFYDGLTLMEDVANAMTQLDASLYTPLFIPGDDGQITVEQRRYQEQAREFYFIAVNGLDRFLSNLPADDLQSATSIANATKYEIDLEIE